MVWPSIALYFFRINGNETGHHLELLMLRSVAVCTLFLFHSMASNVFLTDLTYLQKRKEDKCTHCLEAKKKETSLRSELGKAKEETGSLLLENKSLKAKLKAAKNDNTAPKVSNLLLFLPLLFHDN